MGTDNRKKGDELATGVLGGMFSGQANFDRRTLKENCRDDAYGCGTLNADRQQKRSCREMIWVVVWCSREQFRLKT
jgi:hypothetical protein